MYGRGWSERVLALAYEERARREARAMGASFCI